MRPKRYPYLGKKNESSNLSGDSNPILDFNLFISKVVKQSNPKKIEHIEAVKGLMIAYSSLFK